MGRTADLARPAKIKKRDGFYKSMLLSVKAWDPQQKNLLPPGKAELLPCDLFVIASGGGAINDPIMKTLGFSHDKLKAKNCGAFGIFTLIVRYDDPGGPTFDRNLRDQVGPVTKQIVSGQIGFTTPDHNLSLVRVGVRVHESQEGLAVYGAHRRELHPDSLPTFRPPHDSFRT